MATLHERQHVHKTTAPPTGPTPLEPEVIILNGEAAENGKAQMLRADKVKTREPSRILCNNSTSVNDAPPINPSLQLAMQYLDKYDNVNDRDLSLRGRPVSGMESEEDCNLERSALEQKDEINPFSNQNKTSAPLRGQARNDVAGGICFEFQKNGAYMRRNCKYIDFNHTAAYPNVGPIRGESSKTSPRPRPMPRPGKGPRTEFRRDRSRVKNRICYSYHDRGYCSFGSKCRLSHQESVPPYAKYNSNHDPNLNNNVNVNNFLEGRTNVLNTLKGIVEMQHQPTSLPFTNVQGYQH